MTRLDALSWRIVLLKKPSLKNCLQTEQKSAISVITLTMSEDNVFSLRWCYVWEHDNATQDSNLSTGNLSPS